jgi:site-specific DNA recombinase
MGGTPLMRLVLAARLSQLSRGGETGIDTQDEDARLWAERNGHTIVGVCADDISGVISPFKRKELGPWLTDPDRLQMYDGILATKMDRYTRARDWGIRQWAEKHGKKLLIVSPELVWPPEPSDATTPIIWDNLVNIAISEWQNTSQRYRRMLKSKRDQGYFTGKRPYGYRIVAVEGGKILEPDPVTAPIVRGMANRYDEDGWSLRQIADWLTKSAIVPSQQGNRKHAAKWSAQTVRWILANPAIMGRVQINGVTTHRAEPLISPEQFRRIQEKMAARAHHGAPSGTTALLTSMLVCVNGHSMHRLKAHATSKLPNGRYYYYCRECPRGHRPFIWCEDIDGAVDDAVMAMTDMEHVITTVKPGDSYGEEIKQIKKEIAALDPESDDWGKRTAELRAEIAELRSRPRKKAEIITKRDGRSVSEVWESLDTTEQRRNWLLARRGSNWLPGQDKAKVQVLGRDSETDALITNIDLGEYTESMTRIRALPEPAANDQQP